MCWVFPALGWHWNYFPVPTWTHSVFHYDKMEYEEPVVADAGIADAADADAVVLLGDGGGGDGGGLGLGLDDGDDRGGSDVQTQS